MNSLDQFESIRKEQISHFDDVQFAIDIQSQTTLLSTTDPKERERIEQLNQKMVDLVKRLHDENVKAIKEYRNSPREEKFPSIEHLKAAILKGDCVYFDREALGPDLLTKSSIGFLLVTDWYLDENQIKYLRLVFKFFGPTNLTMV